MLRYNELGRKRGRPLGFKLSESSKRQISHSKTGQRHKSETKDKISRSLLIYFQRKSPLSEELLDVYLRMNDDSVGEWLLQVQDELDTLDDVKTERMLCNSRKIELSFGANIEYFGHNLTPEMIVLCNEYCKENGFAYDEIEDDL